MKLCDICGKREAITFGEPDPFIAELYPEELTEEDNCDWCEDCYDDRKGDI